MIYDLRTYTVRPGTMAKQLALYEKHGFAAQTKNLGAPLFYGVVETGDVNSYIHLWQYEDAADRELRRSALYADKDWLRYRDLSAQAGYQVSQTNTILKAAPFWSGAKG